MRPPREDTLPWYKQFWPWFLISLPLSVVIASIVTINIAIKTNDGLVSDDYYKEGLAIHMDADSAARAHELGIAAGLAYDAETGALGLQLDKPLPNGDRQLTLTITHPTLPDQDQAVQLTAVDQTHFAGRINPLTQANWKLALRPADRDWRVEGRLLIPSDGTARLD
jgi:hypothetical protein